MPHTMPWLNQLDTIESQAPEPKSQSPSLDVMPRAHVSRCFRARMSDQIIAIGVRDSVLPPIPTVSPSFTSAAASSSDITFSCRLRSRSVNLRRSSRYDSAGIARPGVVVEVPDELVPGG